ncbi:MAG TPA: hypothetical protein VJ608_09670, partial [Albitalea sp.]|nr:hypothetical protein [Albitalea sp.]
ALQNVRPFPMRIPIRRAIALAGFALLISLPCVARTFKFVDTTTGKPIVGVNAHLIATGTVPVGIGHSGQFTLAEWDRTSDESGEIRLSSMWADRAWLTWFEKPGYGHTDTVHEYTYRRSENADRDVTFMTPSADLALERLQFAYFQSARAVDNHETIMGASAIGGIAMFYAGVRGIAKSPRELNALRQFCRFAPAMVAQREAGWPDISRLPEIRSAAQALIDDCIDTSSAASSPSK